MKILKSAILGTALVAASWGAQAADLPVKARPVEYVKICSVYGAGFYYIPGTDICLRVGGYLYANWAVNNHGSGPNIYAAALGANPSGLAIDDRNLNADDIRTRIVYIMDARTPTPYGTVRAYAAFGINWTSTAVAPDVTTGATGINQALYLERAFIQVGGFTAGFTESFFSFGTTYGMDNYLPIWSGRWIHTFGYTAQMGNGLSATLAVEDMAGRRNRIIGGNTAAGSFVGDFATAFASNGYGGGSVPDIVGNLRVDQVWGSAQVMAALHQVYSNQGTVNIMPGADEELGFALGAGIEVKVPSAGAGDSFIVQGVWARGAIEYTGISSSPYGQANWVGNRAANGVGPLTGLFDAAACNNVALGCAANGSLELSTAWLVSAAYRHFWSPQWRSTLGAGINQFNPPNAATLVGYPDLRIFTIVGNLIWSPVKDLDIGVEVVYNNVETDCANLGAACAADALRGKNRDVLGGVFKVRRNW